MKREEGGEDDTLSELGRSVGLISKRRGEDDPSGPGSLAAEDTRLGKVGQRTRSILVRSTFGPCENARSGVRQNGDAPHLLMRRGEGGGAHER